MNIQQLKITDLNDAEYNPRSISEEELSGLRASLSKYGQVENIVVNKDLTIISGHQRKKAWERLGNETISAIVLDLDKHNEKKLNVLMNSQAISGTYDDGKLSEILETLKFDEDYQELRLDELEPLVLEDENPPEEGDDEVPEVKEKPFVVRGDIFEIKAQGLKYRIGCLDSRSIDDVEKLMDGAKVNMVFQDPPYNLKISIVSNHGQSQHEEFKMASGEMTEEEFIDFLTSAFNCAVAVSADGAIHYNCMDWKHIYEIMIAIKASYTEFKQLVVWNKNKAGLGGFYRSKHELIFIAKVGKGKHTNNFFLGANGRYRTNVWDYRSMNGGGPEERAELRLHPTVKPLEMVSDAIIDCSNPKENVLDLFSGSGTTIVACIKNKRNGYSCDLDEHYTEVSMARSIQFLESNQIDYTVTLNGEVFAPNFN